MKVHSTPRKTNPTKIVAPPPQSKSKKGVSIHSTPVSSKPRGVTQISLPSPSQIQTYHPKVVPINSLGVHIQRAEGATGYSAILRNREEVIVINPTMISLLDEAYRGPGIMVEGINSEPEGNHLKYRNDVRLGNLFN